MRKTADLSSTELIRDAGMHGSCYGGGSADVILRTPYREILVCPGESSVRVGRGRKYYNALAASVKTNVRGCCNARRVGWADRAGSKGAMPA